MRLIAASLPRHISWLCKRGDPRTFDIPALGLSLISPISYANLPHPFGGPAPPSVWELPIGPDAILITSEAIWLNPMPGFEVLPDWELLPALTSFLTRLRFCSKQATLPLSSFYTRQTEFELVASTSWPEAPDEIHAVFRKVLFDWAVRAEHIGRVAAEWEKLEVPLFHNLMLDATEAASDHDYRGALLYSAIAVETAATTLLDEAYERILNHSISLPEYRVRTYPAGGGETVTKDAVFAILRDREQFSTLLHEMPLYVLGRSMALEEPSVFHGALRLYRTRNKIAHIGEPPVGDQYYPLTRDGADIGLDSALAALYWYDPERGYINPLKHDLVSLEDLSS